MVSCKALMEGVQIVSENRKVTVPAFFSHYFIMMETADSAGPHLHKFYRTEATSSAWSRLCCTLVLFCHVLLFFTTTKTNDTHFGDSVIQSFCDCMSMKKYTKLLVSLRLTGDTMERVWRSKGQWIWSVVPPSGNYRYRHTWAFMSSIKGISRRK